VELNRNAGKSLVEKGIRAEPEFIKTLFPKLCMDQKLASNGR